MLTPEQVLDLIPQQRPFRFIDRLVELGEASAVGEYTFRDDETFYAGHFPGHPVTPGVILIETMCQTGLVALGIHLLGMELPAREVAKTVTLFTDAEVEFERVVGPGGDGARLRREDVLEKEEAEIEGRAEAGRRDLRGRRHGLRHGSRP